MTESEALEKLKLEGGLEISGKPKRAAEFFEALGIAEKALEEIQQYRAIGTVSEFRELKEKATAIKSDGFSDHLLNMGYTKGMKDGYAKAIEEFAEKMKESMEKKYRHLIDVDRDGFEWLTTDAVETHIDETVKEMKGE